VEIYTNITVLITGSVLCASGRFGTPSSGRDPSTIWAKSAWCV